MTSPPDKPLLEAGLEEDEMPRVQVTRRNLIVGGLFIVGIIAFIYIGLPRISGLDDTWEKVHEGNPFWLATAFAFTIASFGGYVLLFRGVYIRAGLRLTFSESYQITMAGLAATRLFAAGGAGGIALTAWALRRAGMDRREVADNSVTFLVLMYAVYMVAMLIGGLGLRVGLFPGKAPFGVTVVPAIVAGVTIMLALLISLTPTDLQHRLATYGQRGGRFAGLVQRLSNAPAALSAGVRGAGKHVRDGDPALVGAILFWALNVGVLWASFKAFGSSPSIAVLTMGFFVGMLFNLLPLPGGVGGVDGGMIGALLAFGEADKNTVLLAVLTYRAFAFYIPTIPGAVAYFQLRKTVQGWARPGHKPSERARKPAAIGATT
ncbi:MAG TPA: lysylphosphatidylglycerol synthase transmembrane domain-containing protein [Baekduia sp.]|nr:lysylphosphatidylglycerol synthase transmembrane domain-containing protein [Baekduia sp.]